jgi:hypothetical protein
LNSLKAGAGVVAKGDPIGGHDTPAVSSAKKDIVVAAKLLETAKEVTKNPTDAVNQKRLAVTLERISAGRFTTQALDYIIKAGWGNTVEQWVNSPTTGALPRDVVRQLVDGAQENYNGALAGLSEAKKLNESDTATPDTPKSDANSPMKIKLPSGKTVEIN